MKLRESKFPLLVLALLSIAFVAYVLGTAPQLPERIATHFSVDGQANGWMTRASHLKFILGLGLGGPLAMLLISEVVKRFGGVGLNIPNRDYWLAPERRVKTLAFAQRMLVWNACLFSIFAAFIHHLILRANTGSTLTLPPGEFGLGFALLFAGIVVWTVLFIRPFLRKA